MMTRSLTHSSGGTAGFADKDHPLHQPALALLSELQHLADQLETRGVDLEELQFIAHQMRGVVALFGASATDAAACDVAQLTQADVGSETVRRYTSVFASAMRADLELHCKRLGLRSSSS